MLPLESTFFAALKVTELVLGRGATSCKTAVELVLSTLALPYPKTPTFVCAGGVRLFR